MGIYAVGDVIRRTRESIGMTQEELCEGICETVTLSRIENGKSTPTRANFELLMERMGKDGKKYLPFIRSSDIEDHVLREEVDRELHIHDYQAAERKLKRLEENLDFEDAVNRQYVLRIQAIIESRMGKISMAKKREKLTDALKCTVPDLSKEMLVKGILTEQELLIICNIAMIYMEEKQYEQSIQILQKLKEYMENVPASYSNQIQRLILSNLGQALGLDGKAEEAGQIQRMAAELAKKENNAGSMVLILYDQAYDYELCGEDKEICLRYLAQAYVLAECIEYEYMIDHIRKHVISYYGESEWNKFSSHLASGRLEK